jgi:hypothetical protein
MGLSAGLISSKMAPLEQNGQHASSTHAVFGYERREIADAQRSTDGRRTFVADACASEPAPPVLNNTLRRGARASVIGALAAMRLMLIITERRRFGQQFP